MGNIVLLIGLGVIGFLLAYLFFNFGKDEISQKHYLLRLLLIGCLFGVFVLIGKAGFDSTQTCELVNNYTDTVHMYGNNFTYENGTATYHWDYAASGVPPTADKGVFLFHKKEYKEFDVVCFESDLNNTANTFYVLTLWIVRLISSYILVYLFYEIFIYMRNIIAGKRGRSK